MATIRTKAKPQRISFPMFDLAALSDSCLLTPKEAGSLLRVAKKTMDAWRRDPHHPLCWVRVGSRPRYRVGDVRALLAGGPADKQRNDAARPARRGRPRPKQQARAVRGRAKEARLGAD